MLFCLGHHLCHSNYPLGVMQLSLFDWPDAPGLWIMLKLIQNTEKNVPKQNLQLHLPKKQLQKLFIVYQDLTAMQDYISIQSSSKKRHQDSLQQKEK